MGAWLRPGRSRQPTLPLLRGSGPSSWLSPALACPWPRGSSYRGGFRGSILPSSAAGSVWTGSSRAIRHPTGATFGLALVPGDLGRATRCPHPPGPGRAQRSTGARLRPEPPQLRGQDWVGQGHGRPIPPRLHAGCCHDAGGSHRCVSQGLLRWRGAHLDLAVRAGVVGTQGTLPRCLCQA